MRPRGLTGRPDRYSNSPNGRPPLDIEVRHAQLLVQPLEPGMKPLVGLLLPGRAGRVAEEHPATERPQGVNAAQFADLERATGPRPLGDGLGEGLWPGRAFEAVQEVGQFQGRDEEAMTVLFE